MDLHEFIHAPAVTCSPRTTLAEAAGLMEREDVGSIVVVHEGGELAGMVTDRDLTIRALARRRDLDSPVSEVMTPHVVFLREDASLFAAATEMATAACRRLPVLDLEGHLAGVIALDDLLTIFARQTDKLAQVAADEAPVPASSAVTHNTT